MRRLLALTLLCVACVASSSNSTTTSHATAPSSTTTTRPSLVECEPPRYLVTTLPARALSDPIESSKVELDRFTLIGGTSSAVWTDEEGAAVLALIRGALPPEEFIGPGQLMKVGEYEAVFGPLTEEVWALAWFETRQERCDLYTLVFYPPVDLSEARGVIEGLQRVEG